MLLPAALSAAQRKLCCLRWIIYSESCIEQEEWARNKEGRGRPWICKRQEIGFRCDKKCSNARSPPQLYWQYWQSTLPILIQKSLEDFEAVSFIFIFRQFKTMEYVSVESACKGEFCWEKESLGTFSERKTGLCGKSSQTGGGGLTQTHFMMSTYQVIFGMPKWFWGAKTCFTKRGEVISDQF